MSTENGIHYKSNIITESMVGQPLDPALIENLNPMDFMLATAMKKVVFAGGRQMKTRKQDLLDAIGAIERQIELDAISEVKVKSISFIGDGKPTHGLVAEPESCVCVGCIFTDDHHICLIGESHDVIRATGVDCGGEEVIFKLKEIK